MKCRQEELSRERGFGFLIGDDGRKIFIHITDRAPKGGEDQLESIRCPDVGNRIVFQLEQTYKGPKAVSWDFAQEPKKTFLLPKAAPAKPSGVRLRMVRIRTVDGKPSEEKTIWKGGSAEACALKHPRTGDFTDSLLSTDFHSNVRQEIRFEINNGVGWVQCEDFRPLKADLVPERRRLR
jgi:cold shock CspA family protein